VHRQEKTDALSFFFFLIFTLAIFALYVIIDLKPKSSGGITDE